MEKKQVKAATVYLTVYPDLKKRLRALAEIEHSTITDVATKAIEAAIAARQSEVDDIMKLDDERQAKLDALAAAHTSN